MAPPAQQGGGRNLILLALAIVLMVFLGIASGVLILTLADERGGTSGGEPTPFASVGPIATDQPDPRETSTATRTPRPGRTPKPTPTLGPPADFVCYESMMVEGPPGTKWDMVPVDFRTGRGYDRVIYQLTRSGWVDDDIVPVAVVRPHIDGEGAYVAEPPWHPDAEARLNVVLANGVRDRSRLDAYEPRGMNIVKSLSTQRYQSHVNYSPPSDDPSMADIGLLSSIDVLGEGCFSLRVVGWDGNGADTAAVYVDIQG